MLTLLQWLSSFGNVDFELVNGCFGDNVQTYDYVSRGRTSHLLGHNVEESEKGDKTRE